MPIESAADQPDGPISSGRRQPRHLDLGISGARRQDHGQVSPNALVTIETPFTGLLHLKITILTHGPQKHVAAGSHRPAWVPATRTTSSSNPTGFVAHTSLAFASAAAIIALVGTFAPWQLQWWAAPTSSGAIGRGHGVCAMIGVGTRIEPTAGIRVASAPVKPSCLTTSRRDIL